jgi:hypothetical protein
VPLAALDPLEALDPLAALDDAPTAADALAPPPIGGTWAPPEAPTSPPMMGCAEFCITLTAPPGAASGGLRRMSYALSVSRTRRKYDEGRLCRSIRSTQIDDAETSMNCASLCHREGGGG